MTTDGIPLATSELHLEQRSRDGSVAAAMVPAQFGSVACDGDIPSNNQTMNSGLMIMVNSG